MVSGLSVLIVSVLWNLVKFIFSGFCWFGLMMFVLLIIRFRLLESVLVVFWIVV